MALITATLGEVQGATLSMTIDDSVNKIVNVSVDARNATMPVALRVYSQDGLNEKFSRTFQIGENVSQDLVGNTRLDCDGMQPRPDGHKTIRLVLVPAPYNYGGAA